MARKVTFDFGGNEANFGGGGTSDHVPQGRYVLKIKEFEDTKSRSDRPMWRVTAEIAQGDYIGKRIVEHFVKDQDFAQSRLRALLACLANKDVPNRIEVDLDALIGREFVADLVDDQPKPTEQFPNPQLQSKIGRFIANAQEANGTGPATPVEQAAPPQAQAAPAPAEAAPEPAPEPAPAAVESEAQAADDLFA